MAKFTLTVALDNAAFEDPAELARILQDVARKVQVQVIDDHVTTSADAGFVRDVNGNTVGDWMITYLDADGSTD